LIFIIFISRFNAYNNEKKNKFLLIHNYDSGTNQLGEYTLQQNVIF